MSVLNDASQEHRTFTARATLVPSASTNVLIPDGT